ncbi:hypothetical protein GCM10010988_40030 [Cnuibacter physcomitrellae]|nr:hypothetical protein GCM10010988_40030 [Cnuibacter physcomitrellae]
MARKACEAAAVELIVSAVVVASVVDVVVGEESLLVLALSVADDVAVTTVEAVPVAQPVRTRPPARRSEATSGAVRRTKDRAGRVSGVSVGVMRTRCGPHL